MIRIDPEKSIMEIDLSDQKSKDICEMILGYLWLYEAETDEEKGLIQGALRSLETELVEFYWEGKND